MPTQKGPTLAHVAEAIATELEAAIPFDEFVQFEETQRVSETLWV